MLLYFIIISVGVFWLDANVALRCAVMCGPFTVFISESSLSLSISHWLSGDAIVVSQAGGSVVNCTLHFALFF